jgi:hypothetical protein
MIDVGPRCPHARVGPMQSVEGLSSFVRSISKKNKKNKKKEIKNEM